MLWVIYSELNRILYNSNAIFMYIYIYIFVYIFTIKVKKIRFKMIQNFTIRIKRIQKQSKTQLQ